MVRVVSGLPAGKTCPPPKDPVVMDQNGCLYNPHVFGLQVGQTAQGAQLRRHPAQRPRAAQGQRAVQHGDAADPQGGRARLRQARGHVQDQVRRASVDDRLRDGVQQSLLRGHRATTGSSRSPTCRRAPTRSRPGTRSWARRPQTVTVGADDTKSSDFKFSAARGEQVADSSPARRVFDEPTAEGGHAAKDARAPATTPSTTRSSASGASTSSPPITRPSASSTRSPGCCSSSSASR